MRQIIAVGGGGFSTDPNQLSLEVYILAQTGRKRPKICFLPTASGDADSYILKFYQAFSQLECQPSTLSLFRLPQTSLEDYVFEKDVIYVGGGNTRSMLSLWREWGLDTILKRAYKSGIILAGISAGANCWFEQCTTDSMPGQLCMLPCLGILPGSFTPHYDGETQRRPILQQLIKENGILPGLAADNDAAVHFIDEQPAHAVCTRSGAQVYRVNQSTGEIVEEALEMKLL